MADVEQGVPIVSKRVGRRIKQVRTKLRHLTQQELAEALRERGWPTDRSSVVRLESGSRRRISVDDLVAVAAALNVSPGWLLMEDDAGDQPVEIVGSLEAPAWAAWRWAEGLQPLPPGDAEEFQKARPAELRRREQHAAARAARDLATRIDNLLLLPGRPTRQEALDEVNATLRSARLALARVVAELDEIDQDAQPPGPSLRRSIDEHYRNREGRDA